MLFWLGMVGWVALKSASSAGQFMFDSCSVLRFVPWALFPSGEGKAPAIRYVLSSGSSTHHKPAALAE